jgi:DNA modification methylase
MTGVDLHLGDCLEVLKELEDNSIDSIVTDPPYGLSFMGKKWDYDVPNKAIWQECLRVLKPGGHLLAFAGTRTQHRMAVNIEDAGFEIRDMIAWVYGSGFPKSLDVSKAIDKAAGAEREVVGTNPYYCEGRTADPGEYRQGGKNGSQHITAPATDAAKQWEGWGTALKPAMEPITVARKPLIGTVAENVIKHGTGGINIDGCRVGTEVVGWGGKGRNPNTATTGASQGGQQGGYNYAEGEARPVQGRWPANFIHDGDQLVLELFPGLEKDSAARFFYCAKASKKDRDEGNGHPTVKPTDLMRYLCRLVTPRNGIVLDPFMGSGSTGKAAVLEGFKFVGIEREQEYIDIATARISAAQKKIEEA